MSILCIKIYYAILGMLLHFFLYKSYISLLTVLIFLLHFSSFFTLIPFTFFLILLETIAFPDILNPKFLANLLLISERVGKKGLENRPRSVRA